MKLKKLVAASLAVLTLASFSAFAAKAKKVKFSWWHIGTAEKDKVFFQSVADEFMKANPNVEIDITVLENEAFKSKLTTVMQSKNPPDVFTTWGGGVLQEYAAAGLVKDITKDIKGDLRNSMSEGVWKPYQYKGKQYGIPHDMGAVTFWYNKDILAKVGYNSFPSTWDDFITLVKKLKAEGITPIALGGGDKWPAMYYFSYLALRLGGADLFPNLTAPNSKGFNDPAFIKAMTMFKELVDLNPFQTGYLGASYNDQGTAMGNGKAAMELMGQWAPTVEMDTSVDKKGIGDALACAAFPAVSGGKGKITEVMGGGGGFAVGKKAPKEAIEFLKFFNNKENSTAYARTGGIIPTVKGAEAGLADANARLVKSVVDKCTSYMLYPDQDLSPAQGAAVNDNVQAVLAGTKTPAQACAAMQEALED